MEMVLTLLDVILYSKADLKQYAFMKHEVGA